MASSAERIFSGIVGKYLLLVATLFNLLFVAFIIHQTISLSSFQSTCNIEKNYTIDPLAAKLFDELHLDSHNWPTEIIKKAFSRPEFARDLIRWNQSRMKHRRIQRSPFIVELQSEREYMFRRSDPADFQEINREMDKIGVPDHLVPDEELDSGDLAIKYEKANILERKKLFHERGPKIVEDLGVPYSDGLDDSKIMRRSTDPKYSAYKDARMLAFENVPTPTNKNAKQEVYDFLPSHQVDDLKARVDEYYMVGYDCTNPRIITPTSSFITNPCVDQTLPGADVITKGDIKDYQLLQYETAREIDGFKCELRRSVWTYYCGVYDHSTPVPQESFFGRRVPVSTETCRQLVNDGTYTADDGLELQVPLNAEVSHSYWTLGKSFVYGKDGSAEISCEGGKMAVENKVADNIVQYVTDKITYQKETFLERPDGSIVAFYDNILLNCPLNQRYCKSANIRYVWEYSTQQHCPLLLVKNFQGYVVNTDNSPDTVLMSSDGSLIRVILKGQIEECKLMVFRTNYPELVVALARNEDGSVKNNLISRNIKNSPRNIQIGLYITNRDDSLYHTIVSRIKEEFKAVIQDNCQRNLDKAKLTHFLERRMPSFHTYRLGGDNFLTTAGEIVYSYKCC